MKMFFTRKARWVKDGHRIPDPDTSSYAGVVSRESILISLTTASFWGLDFMESYIRNEYLQSSLIGETLYNIGLEHQGKLSMIVRELYGGDSSRPRLLASPEKLYEILGL